MMSLKRITALLFVALFATTVGAAKTKTVKATGPWVASGKAYQTGADTVLFVGAFSGVMLLDEPGEALDAAEFTCPGMQDVDYAKQRVKSSGRCIFETSGGNKVFARWSCEGDIGDCRGEMKLLAGTGVAEGITGGGTLRLRSFFADITEQDDGEITVEKAVGLMTWPKLTYRLPND